MAQDTKKPTDAVKASTSGTQPPLQPNTQVRMPPRPTDPDDLVRSNDPITNKAEQKRADEAQVDLDEESRRQEEEQKKQAEEEQRRADERREAMQEIVKSPEGFVVRTEDNAGALDALVTEGTAYQTNVQSGKGGLDVEERVYLAERGYTQLRDVFGPDLGAKK
jgi:hypothetical protein